MRTLPARSNGLLRISIATGLLLLLLYQLIGLPLMVLTFEQGYERAGPARSSDGWRLIKLPVSLPYTPDWTNADGQPGLVQADGQFYNVVHQQYANDTLYTLLKTNQNAKERFSELAGQLQQLTNGEATADTPAQRLFKLLLDRLTVYLEPADCRLSGALPAGLARQAEYVDPGLSRYGVQLPVHGPPPKAYS